MPNRIIKESICTSEDIAKLSQGAEILFYRLIVKADDYGCYYGNETIIKNTCFPLKSDDIKLKQLNQWLAELVNCGIIYHYEAEDGKKYIQIVKWANHQQIRAKKSKYPPYSDTCNQVISDDYNSPRNPIQSNPNPIQSEHDIRMREAFDAFWEVYPKKVAKQDAIKAFTKLTEEEYPLLIPAVEWQKQTDGWKKQKGKFVPNPATWLNGRRWEDEAECDSDWLDANEIQEGYVRDIYGELMKMPVGRPLTAEECHRLGRSY